MILPFFGIVQTEIIFLEDYLRTKTWRCNHQPEVSPTNAATLKIHFLRIMPHNANDIG